MLTEYQYNYIARAKDGSIRRGEIKAADRNDVIRRLKGQDMTPLGVMEAKPKVAIINNGLSPRLTAIVSVCLFVLTGSTIVWLMHGRKYGNEVHRESQPVAAMHHIKQNSNNHLGQIQDVKPLVNKGNDAGISLPADTKIVASAVIVPLTNHTNAPPPRRERPVRQYIPPGGTNSPPAMFTTQTEQVLAYFANARLGDMPPPPLPDVYKREDIAKILDTDIVVYETDNETINSTKVDVAYAKNCLKDFIANGGSMKDFVSHYQEEMTKAYRERQEAQQHLMGLIKSNDVSSALAFFEEQNAIFTTKGIKPLLLPQILQTQ